MNKTGIEVSINVSFASARVEAGVCLCIAQGRRLKEAAQT
jgi:hypothetical protein